MSDWQAVGNLARPALAAASLAVWMAIAARRMRGLPPLDIEPRMACPWHPLAVALALPLAMGVQRAMLSVVPREGGTTLDVVQSSCLAMILSSLIVMGLLALFSPMSAADFGVQRGRAAADLKIGVLGYLAALVPVFAINLAVQYLGLRPTGPQHSFLKFLDQDPGAAAVAWIVLSAGILAPLVEELLYRVILQGWLETRLAPGAAIVAVALLFAGVHEYDALPLIPLALILGYVYHRRHSYLAVVALHATFNLTNLALALVHRPT